jgi:flagellar biosynthesis protein FliP
MKVVMLLLSLSIALFHPFYVDAQTLPDLSVTVGGEKLVGDGTLSSSLRIVILLTLLSFAPALVLTMTSFTRIAIVLGMTRTALGTQSAPPNMVITGLSLFLTFAIMSPVFQASYSSGVKPFLDGSMDQAEALTRASIPLKKFLVDNAREKDLALFLDIAKVETPKDLHDVPLMVAIPSFVLSELNTAFQIGFLISLPFLILDMVVSSILTTMSMITLPPVVVSLPLKLMLFVLIDGWQLIIVSLIKTYQV